MQKIRCGKTVWTRDDEFSSWQDQQFDSLNQAKKANGPNSTTVESAKMLPPVKVKDEEVA